MTEGPTPRDPSDEPPRERPGEPEAPVEQPPPAYRPADYPPGTPEEAPRWESPGAPPPPAPPGGTWEPQPGSPPPPPPPPAPAGGQGWQAPGGYQQPGGYPGQPAGSGMSENVASGLSYVLTWVTGLIFFLIDKRPEVRFHAMQSIAYGVLWTLVGVVGPRTPGPIAALFSVLWLVLLVGWIILMVQGFQGKHFKLPVIGDFAEQQAGGRPGL
jgi:uncharacterized membrane protein